MKFKIEKEEYTNRTFRLNIHLISEMYKVCDEKGISLNKFIDIIIRYALENLEKDTDNTKNKERKR